MLQGPHCTGIAHRVLPAPVQLLSGSSAGPLAGCEAPATADGLSACASAQLSPPGALSCAAHSEDGPPEQLCGVVTAGQCKLCKAGRTESGTGVLSTTALLRAVPQTCSCASRNSGTDPDTTASCHHWLSHLRLIRQAAPVSSTVTKAAGGDHLTRRLSHLQVPAHSRSRKQQGETI